MDDLISIVETLGTGTNKVAESGKSADGQGQNQEFVVGHDDVS